MLFKFLLKLKTIYGQAPKLVCKSETIPGDALHIMPGLEYARSDGFSRRWKGFIIRKSLDNHRGNIISHRRETENLRGKIQNFRGETENLRGKIQNFRRETENLRGKIQNFRGETENLRGKIQNFRGETGNLRGVI
jgi:predicted nuclease with TOPRIM domain